MKQTLTILITILSLSAFAQIGEKKLDDQAFDFYLDKKYDSALIYYQKITKKKNRASDPYYLNQIGDCFFYLGKYEQAKKHYLQSLKDTSEAGPYAPQRGSCHNLADVYISENKYDSALYFLRLAEDKWPHLRICSAGEFERLSVLNHKFAICFNGISQPDTAIKYLTQYAFYTTDWYGSNHDSLKYLELVNFYLGVLGKRYSANEIKGEFNTAVKNFYYKKELDLEFKKKYPKENYYRVESYIIFFGNKVILRDGMYEANSWGGEPVAEYSKQYLFKEFSESTLVKLLKKY